MIKFVRDDGATLKLSDYFRILSIDGLGILSQEIFTEKRAIGDGDIITGSRISSRTITITACNDNAGTNDTARVKINAFFNPKNKFKFYITYKGNTVWCECIVDTRDLPTDNIYSSQILTLSVYCPNPYFKSFDDFGKDLASITPMMGFPLMISQDKGFVISVRDFSRRVFVPNDGAIDTYCTAVIELEEDVSGLKIYKNNDEFILFTTKLKARSAIEINFETRTITIDGKKTFNCIDRKSTFFAIDKGGCIISYMADSNENGVHLFLYYNQLYLGV